MTPAVASAMTISKEDLPLNNKLRKPAVEKMRRDHINSSIEQLDFPEPAARLQAGESRHPGDATQPPETTAAETACFLDQFNSCQSRLLQMGT
ncbi:hypothetical protein SRHO_G00274100 [Serrasalmus rhombeus]